MLSSKTCGRRVKHRLKVAWDDVHVVTRASSTGASAASARMGRTDSAPAVDQIAQGMGGLMAVTGLPGQGPVRAGIAIADMTAGTTLALGVMVALYDFASARASVAG